MSRNAKDSIVLGIGIGILISISISPLMYKHHLNEVKKQNQVTYTVKREFVRLVPVEK